MVRTVDYETRRRAILQATINKYIQEATPVASEDIASDFDLSSATIRNIFAELEESGYLIHPYTSGGRVPTHKGYRYYVDFLISQMPACQSGRPVCRPGRELLEREKESIVKEYESQINRLEDALEKTSEVLSTVTHCAGIVSSLDWQDRFLYKGISFILEQPEFKDSTRIRLLIKIIEDKRRLLNVINQDFKERVRIYIGDELGCSEMDSCALAVSNYYVKNKPQGRLAVLGPMRMEYKHVIPTLEYISEVLTEVLERI